MLSEISPRVQGSYQGVVFSVVVGSEVVVVMVVVGGVVLLARSLCCRRRRIFISRNRRRWALFTSPPLPTGIWLLNLEFGIWLLLCEKCRPPPLLPLVSNRMGLLPWRAMICLMRSQLDLLRSKLHRVAPGSNPTTHRRVKEE